MTVTILPNPSLPGDLEFVPGFTGLLSLFCIVIENDRTVIRSDVRPLPVQLGRVMDRPENGQELVVGDPFRVVGYLHDLGMPGPAGADLFVGGVLCCPSHVPGRCCRNSLNLAECSLDTPETTGTEGCCFFPVPASCHAVSCTPSPSGTIRFPERACAYGFFLPGPPPMCIMP